MDDSPLNQLAHPLMSNEDERHWGRQLIEGSESEREEATTTFVKLNQKLVRKVAGECVYRGLDLDDLMQEGNIGLLRAIERFDYRRGFKFSTYATWWIRQGITRAVADQGRNIRLPNHVIESLSKLSKQQQELSKQLRREPTIGELATALQLTPKTVRQLLAAKRNTTSLDAQKYGKDDDMSLADVLPSNINVEEDVEDNLLVAEVADLLTALPPRTAAVLRYRYGLGGAAELTLQEIADQVKISRERVRQIEAEGLDLLKLVARRRPGLRAMIAERPENTPTEQRKRKYVKPRPARAEITTG